MHSRHRYRTWIFRLAPGLALIITAGCTAARQASDTRHIVVAADKEQKSDGAGRANSARGHAGAERDDTDDAPLGGAVVSTLSISAEEAASMTQDAPAKKTGSRADKRAEQRVVADSGSRASGTDLSTHLIRGRRALERGEPDRAIAAARAALRMDADAIEAISLMAAAYMEKRYFDRARSILEAATARAPGAGSAKLWMQLGLVYEQSDPGREKRAYQRATELKPNYAKAWTNLGAVHIDRGDYASAVSALETALSLEPDSPAALTNLGTAYRRRAAAATGAAADPLLRKAESHYLAVIRQHPDYAPAHLDLGLLYLDADPFPGMDTRTRLEAAVQHLTQFNKLGWQGARLASAGNAYLDEAVRALRAAAEHSQRQKRKRSKKRR